MRRRARPASICAAKARSGGLSRLAIDGFGGVTVTGAGALLPEGGEISGRIRAPRFETLAALAGPLLPETRPAGAGRASATGSRGSMRAYRLTRAAAGDTASPSTAARRPGRLALDGRLDRAGAWTGADAALRPCRPPPGLLGARLAGADAGRGGQARAGAGAGRPHRLAGRAGAVRSCSTMRRRGASAADGTGGRAGPDAARRSGASPAGRGARRACQARLRGRFGRPSTISSPISAARRRAARSSLPREGAYSGKLVLPRADLRALLGASLGGVAATPGAAWSTARFGARCRAARFHACGRGRLAAGD